jgi:hypothetical protein
MNASFYVRRDGGVTRPPAHPTLTEVLTGQVELLAVRQADAPAPRSAPPASMLAQ